MSSDATIKWIQALPSFASLVEVCGHDGVTIEALRARGSEAAAKETDWKVRDPRRAGNARPRDA